MKVSKSWIAGLVFAVVAPLACSKDEPAATEPVASTSSSTKPSDSSAPKKNDAAPAAAAMPSTATSSASATKPTPAPSGTTANTTPVSAASTASGKQFYVMLHALNVRSGPSKSAKVVRLVKFNEAVNDLGRKDGWVKVGDGAYVWAKYLSATKNKQPILASEPAAAAPKKDAPAAAAPAAAAPAAAPKK